MSVAAVMLVRDEQDVIEGTIRHLLGEGVDEIIVANNLSEDGTPEILAALANEFSPKIDVRLDPVRGYYQDAKMTAMAVEAYERGHAWVVPCDADELWYSPDGRLSDVLGGVAVAGASFARALVYTHVETGQDDPQIANPFLRLGWREREIGLLRKLACRTDPSLWIEPGNHEASVEIEGVRVRSDDRTAFGHLLVRHFPARSAEQYVRKIANGYDGYAAAPDLDPLYATHWKRFGPPTGETFEADVRAFYRRWCYAPFGRAAQGLVYDPAPIR